MFWYSFTAQFSEMIRKKTTVFTFFLLFIISMINFWVNMVTNYKMGDITQMYDTIKCITLSEHSTLGYYLIQFYPLIVVLPTACAYLTDRDTRMSIYIESRVDNKCYWYSKLLSVFVVTFVVFSVPFILELIISLMSFGTSPIGDPTNVEFLFMMENEQEYFLNNLFLNNKVIYVIVMIMMFGIVSGILAVFNFSVVSLPFFKYKIFAFFPIYVLLYIISFVEKVLRKPYTFNYNFILKIFPVKEMNYPVYLMFFAFLIMVSLLLIKIKIKRNEII